MSEAPPGAPQWRPNQMVAAGLGEGPDLKALGGQVANAAGKAARGVGSFARRVGDAAGHIYDTKIKAVNSGGIVEPRAGGPSHTPEITNGITELTIGSSEADAPTLYILSDVSDLSDPDNPRPVKQVKLGPPPDKKDQPTEAKPVLAKRVGQGKDKKGKDLWSFERVPIDAGGQFVFPKPKDPNVSYGIVFYTPDGQPHFVAAQNLSLTPTEPAQATTTAEASPAVEPQGATTSTDLPNPPSHPDATPPPPPATALTAREHLADRIILSGVNTNERRVFDVVEDIMAKEKSAIKRMFAEFTKEKLAKHVEGLQDAILSPFSRESIVEARKLAEVKYQDHLKELRGQSELKYWKTRIGEALKDRFSTGETMVEKFTLKELENKQNTALQAVIEGERAAFRADQTAVTERFDAAAQVTGERINNFIRKGMGEDLKHLPDDHELSKEMKNIIRERLTGKLNDTDFDTRLKNLGTLARDKYPAELRGVKYFDNTVREVTARYEAEFQGRLEHADGLADLDAKLAQTQVALGIGQMGEATQFTPTETRAWVKKIDATAKWLKDKFGWNIPGLVNPYTAGTAFSAVIALSQIPKTIVSMQARAATVWAGGVGGAAVSGAFVALEENRRLQRDYFNFLGKREAGQRGISKEWKMNDKFRMNEQKVEDLAEAMSAPLLNAERSDFKEIVTNDEFSLSLSGLINAKSRLRVGGRAATDGKLRIGLIDFGAPGQVEDNRTTFSRGVDTVEDRLRLYAAAHRTDLNTVLGSSDDFDTFLNKCVNMQVEVLDKGRDTLDKLQDPAMRLALDPLSGYNPEIEVVHRNWRGVEQTTKVSGIDAIYAEAKRDFRGRAIKKGAVTGAIGFGIGLGVSEVLTTSGSVINDVILHKGVFHGGPILSLFIDENAASNLQVVSPDLDVTSAQDQVMVRLTNGETVSVLSANDIRLNDSYELSQSAVNGLQERAAAHGLSLAQGTEILTVADATGPAHQIFTDSTGHAVMGPPQLHLENADGMHRLVLEVVNNNDVPKEVLFYETPIGTPVNDEGVMRVLSNHPLLQFHNDLTHTTTTIPGEMVTTHTGAAGGGLVEVQVADFGPSHGAKGISELAARQMFNPDLNIDNPNGAANVLTKLGKEILQEQGLNPYNLQTEDVVKLPPGFFEAEKLGKLVDEAVKMHELNPEVFNNAPTNDLHKIVWDSVAGGDLNTQEANILLEHLGGGAAATTTVTQALPTVVNATSGGLYIDVREGGEIVNNILAVTQATPETAGSGVYGIAQAIDVVLDNALNNTPTSAGDAAPFIFPIPIVPTLTGYEPGITRGTDHRAEPTPPPTSEPAPATIVTLENRIVIGDGYLEVTESGLINFVDSDGNLETSGLTANEVNAMFDLAITNEASEEGRGIAEKSLAGFRSQLAAHPKARRERDFSGTENPAVGIHTAETKGKQVVFIHQNELNSENIWETKSVTCYPSLNTAIGAYEEAVKKAQEAGSLDTPFGPLDRTQKTLQSLKDLRQGPFAVTSPAAVPLSPSSPLSPPEIEINNQQAIDLVAGLNRYHNEVPNLEYLALIRQFREARASGNLQAQNEAVNSIVSALEKRKAEFYEKMTAQAAQEPEPISPADMPPMSAEALLEHETQVSQEQIQSSQLLTDETQRKAQAKREWLQAAQLQKLANDILNDLSHPSNVIPPAATPPAVPPATTTPQSPSSPSSPLPAEALAKAGAKAGLSPQSVDKLAATIDVEPVKDEPVWGMTEASHGKAAVAIARLVVDAGPNFDGPLKTELMQIMQRITPDMDVNEKFKLWAEVKAAANKTIKETSGIKGSNPARGFAEEILKIAENEPEIEWVDTTEPLAQTLKVEVPAGPKKPVVEVTTAVIKERANKSGVIKLGEVEISSQTHYGEAMAMAQILKNVDKLPGTYRGGIAKIIVEGLTIDKPVLEMQKTLKEIAEIAERLKTEGEKLGYLNTQGQDAVSVAQSLQKIINKSLGQ